LNTEKKIKKQFFGSKIAIRLWCIMMTLVLIIVAFMWSFQILLLEKNYIDSNITEVQTRLEPLMEDLKVEDLAYNERLLSYLSSAANGKMLLVDQSGQLIAMYSYGHPIDMGENRSDILTWERIASSENYLNILNRETYSCEVMADNRVYGYEIGIPVVYYGQPSYIILVRSFTELYKVLDMNRRQLIVLSVFLTLVAAVLAAILARKFIKPIHAIKKTVDSLAAGDLNATPGLNLKDELGQLSHSVEELGQALQRVDVLRKEVIANVSHELRSPLALIGGYAEMVKDINWKNDIKRNEDLDLIIRETRRMSEMVNDIMDYSQLQSGYLQLKKDWYNLCEVVESAVIHCEQSAAEYKIKLQLDCPQADLMVYVDAMKISQVIRNLLDNAINHTKDGDIITASLTASHTGYKVSIINPGDPIPEEDRKVIWERYQRSQHQGGRRQGTGIGLSIVSSILNAHEMPYGVDCADGKTSFWFLYLNENESSL